MNILCSKEDLTKTGVYIFKNSVNNKCYIGSTVMSFRKRMEHHVSLLRANSHKNSHFQAAWNKYGEDVFNFDILEICDKSDCLRREQYYLDNILFAKDYIDKKSDNFLELGYNINPIASGTPNLSSEVIKKRSNTFKKFIGSASEFYSKFKNLEIDYDDIPSLRIEARQKLKMFQPISIGQASRISGVSPADISVLLVYLEHFNRKEAKDESI